MKVTVTISNSLSCFQEYQETGNMPQKRIRTVEMAITDIPLSKGEGYESIHFSLNQQ